ncbi:MAG: hypothetical protein ACI4VF_05125 [Lachnospirales bacterium]
MSLKRILSGAVALAMAFGALSVPTFAADPTVTFESLPVTDIEGNEVTSFAAGDVVVIPVDATSKDGQMNAAQFEITYDADLLTLGATRTATTAVRSFYTSHKDRLQMSGTSIIYGGRDIVSEYDEEFDEYVYDAGLFAVVKMSDGVVRVTWNSDKAGGYTLTDVPEFYVLFTVNDSAKVDEINNGLNGEYVSNLYVISSAGSDLSTTVGEEYDGTYNKLNACYGAFEVSIDNSALETQKIWISEVNADVYTDSTKATKLGTTALEVYTNDGTTTYKFPTRVTANAADVSSAYVEVVATLSDKDGNATGETKTLAAKTISMDSTVTSYDGIAGTSNSDSSLGDGGSED